MLARLRPKGRKPPGLPTILAHLFLGAQNPKVRRVLVLMAGVSQNAIRTAVKTRTTLALVVCVLHPPATPPPALRRNAYLGASNGMTQALHDNSSSTERNGAPPPLRSRSAPAYMKQLLPGIRMFGLRVQDGTPSPSILHVRSPPSHHTSQSECQHRPKQSPKFSTLPSSPESSGNVLINEQHRERLAKATLLKMATLLSNKAATPTSATFVIMSFELHPINPITVRLSFAPSVSPMYTCFTRIMHLNQLKPTGSHKQRSTRTIEYKAEVKLVKETEDTALSKQGLGICADPPRTINYSRFCNDRLDTRYECAVWTKNFCLDCLEFHSNQHPIQETPRSRINTANQDMISHDSSGDLGSDQHWGDQRIEDNTIYENDIDLVDPCG
ncbi:hypothetical protein GGR51DRAFT_557955 [Nemania sp. FL0031]|nr:hypothetical protein GGR51DRAFT_557955 [Nemania sp. FL0031]